MTVELRPLGVTCNIACTYCYQAPLREARNLGSRYDLDAMMRTVECEGGPFTIFGGEPLLVPEKDLETLWAWGYRRFGSNGIQTNGSLINDNHIRMFKAYKVHVGISIDGPGELNDARWARSLEKTRQMTVASEAAIGKLIREGVVPSLIVTLGRKNASCEKLPRMAEWFHDLDGAGITAARLHLLEVESPAVRAELALTDGENIRALEFFESLQLSRLKFDVFEDMRRMLLGLDNNTTCVWNACDPYTTRAVQGVEGFGQRSNCGRTNKDGVDFVKTDQPGYERYVTLYETGQETGGCKGCRFFLMCKGQCPGTALSGDWRYRTEHCEVWKTLFGKIEEALLKEGRIPLSHHPIRAEVEEYLIEGWVQGENRGMQGYLESRGWLAKRETKESDQANCHGDIHGDHFDGP